VSNVIETSRVEKSERCPSVAAPDGTADKLSEYLADESRIAGAQRVKVVYFPANISQLCGALQECKEKKLTISVAGARTGIVGGAVPVESEAVISMERLDSISGLGFSEKDGGGLYIKVGAGVVLSQLQEALRNTRPHEMPWCESEGRLKGQKLLEKTAEKMFYPVDPTELSAQIGGTVATNASGARSYFYGPTRNWVESLKIVTASGELIDLPRGKAVAEDGKFIIKRPCGRVEGIRLPNIRRPASKNTAGYYVEWPDMDAVDLFIGSEGTLGIIVEVGLHLTFEPPERLFATVFLPDEQEAVGLVENLKKGSDIDLLALEYIGPNALDLLRKRRGESGASGGVPSVPDWADCALYVESAFQGDKEFRYHCKTMTELIVEAGGRAEHTWAECSQTQMRAMKAFRHAVPEAVNTVIAERKKKCPTIHKIGTDMAVPDPHLRDVLALYRGELEASGLQYLIFGHIGENHLHVNILPASERDMAAAAGIYERFAKGVVAMGGSVSAEHGIGRLKKNMLRVQFDEKEIAGMQRIKRIFDPDGVLNAGVLF